MQLWGLGKWSGHQFPWVCMCICWAHLRVQYTGYCEQYFPACLHQSGRILLALEPNHKIVARSPAAHGQGPTVNRKSGNQGLRGSGARGTNPSQAQERTQESNTWILRCDLCCPLSRSRYMHQDIRSIYGQVSNPLDPTSDIVTADLGAGEYSLNGVLGRRTICHANVA
ncbi:hypothetical protein BT67DRAFT_160099 [Trichocladium antarcticum]|uniref:Uncharacterized protein n=1 Tax=Trichocladium antarcticum TaxID=1450529 RepID=A0AAN6UE04_9PEZI|nr:hypothetical protein BT67DRAFT_160099 [Trichocladium antarcticum]